MYCVKCETFANDGNFCKVCGGQTIFSKFPCPHCDAPNYVSACFCEHCGKPIQETAKSFVRTKVEELKKEGGEKE